MFRRVLNPELLPRKGNTALAGHVKPDVAPRPSTLAFLHINLFMWEPSRRAGLTTRVLYHHGVSLVPLHTPSMGQVSNHILGKDD